MPERPGFLSEEQLTGGKKRLVIADISEAAEAQAKDVAAARMTEKPEERDHPQGWKKFFSGKFWKTQGKRVWKYNLAADYYQGKYKREAREKIGKGENANLFANEEGADKTSHQAAVKSITERFSASQEFEDEFIHKAAGESRSQLGNSEADQRIKNQILVLVKAYARGTIPDRGAFEAEKAKVFAAVRNLKPEALGKGEMFADNMFEVAQWAKEQVAQAVDHELAIRDLDRHFDFVVGKAKAGVRSEAQFNAVDKIVDFIQLHTRGAFNEASVAAGVAIAYGVGKKVVSGSVKRAAAFFGLGAAAMGAASALRESRKLEMERGQHTREMAQGRKVEGDSRTAERRNELEQSRIQFRKASDLEKDLNTALFDRLAAKDIQEFSEAEYQGALKAVAEIEARIKVSDRGVANRDISKWRILNKDKRYGVDLIGYSDVTKVVQEQDHLDLIKASAKVKLKKWALSHGGRDFNNDLNQAVEGKIQTLFQGDQGILKQNERFVKLKQKRVWQAFKKGAFWGGVWGTVFQEVKAFWDQDQQGGLEHAWQNLRGQQHFAKPGEETSLLEGAWRRGKEFFDSPVHAAGPPHDEILGVRTFRMHDGIKWAEDTSTGNPNDFYLTDAGGNRISENLELNPDRSLTPGAKQWLLDHGYNVNESIASATKGFQGLDPAETKKMFPNLAKHARVDWHDEPGKYWSEIHKAFLEFEGKQQMGYLEKVGDKVFLNCAKVIANFKDNVINNLNDPKFGVVEGYTNPDGSPFVDPKMLELKQQILQAINDGELEKRFQAVIIPTDGANREGLSDLIEGADSRGWIELGEWSKYFTDPKMLRDGHLPMRFMEMRFDGHVMNTVQGLPEVGEAPITEIIPPEEKPPFIVVLPTPIYIPGRRPLESTRRISYYYDGRSYTEISPEERAAYLADMSPRLAANSQTQLNPAEEIPWYFEDQAHRHKEKGYVEELKSLNSQIPEAMNAGTEAVICLAVAGHQEQKNIYRTLEVYSKQTNKDGSVIWQGNNSKFEVLLYINWPPGADPSGTLSEIERFKKQYPQVPVRVVAQENRKGQQLGWLKKKVFDLALLRHMQTGQANKDIILIANDAVMRYAALHYLSDVLQTMNKPEWKKCDAFLGRFDLDPEAYVKNPTFHAAMRYWEISESILRAKNQYLYTQGRNTIMRGSSYAAIGGNRDESFGADTEFGKLFKAARQRDDCIGFLNRDWVMVDPRREIDKFKSGEMVAWTWSGDFDTRNVRGGGKAEHQEPENLNVDTLAEADEDDDIVQQFKARLKEEVQAIQDVFVTSKTKDPKQAARIAKRSASLMGIDIEARLVDGRVVLDLKNTKKLRQGLKSYKDDERHYTKIFGQTYEGDMRLPKTIVRSFEQDPFKFVYSLDTIDQHKMKISREDLVRALFELNGLGNEYGQAKQDAPKLKGQSAGERAIARLLVLMAQKNPALRQKWQAEHPKAYTEWAVGSIWNQLVKKPKTAEGLKDSDLDSYSRELNIPALLILQRLFKSIPSWQKKFDSEFSKAGRPEARREEIMRSCLREIQSTLNIRRPERIRPSPLGGPTPERNFGPAPRPETRLLPRPERAQARRAPEMDQAALAQLAEALRSLNTPAKKTKRKKTK